MSFGVPYATPQLRAVSFTKPFSRMRATRHSPQKMRAKSDYMYTGKRRGRNGVYIAFHYSIIQPQLVHV